MTPVPRDPKVLPRQGEPAKQVKPEQREIPATRVPLEPWDIAVHEESVETRQTPEQLVQPEERDKPVAPVKQETPETPETRAARAEQVQLEQEVLRETQEILVTQVPLERDELEQQVYWDPRETREIPATLGELEPRAPEEQEARWAFPVLLVQLDEPDEPDKPDKPETRVTRVTQVAPAKPAELDKPAQPEPRETLAPQAQRATPVLKETLALRVPWDPKVKTT